MQRYVDRDAATRLWAEDGGLPGGDPLLLVAPANQSAAVWPDELLAALGRRHRLIRYDHRDTGRSGAAEDPGDHADYGVPDLAADALAVLDAFEVERAHVVGVGLGGLIAQLLLLDHPDRLRTVALVCSTALRAPDDPQLPGPDPALLRLWTEAEDPRDDEGELDWRVEHWRLLHGNGSPFDPAAFRALEQRAIAHSGRPDAVTAHTYLDPRGLDRGAELAGVTVPTLVVEAPDDPVHPPPHSAHLAAGIGRTGHPARLVRIPGMGHAVGPASAVPLAAAVLAHTG